MATDREGNFTETGLYEVLVYVLSKQGLNGRVALAMKSQDPHQ